MQSACADADLIVFSHLRWDFVFQRPQHLMTRYATHRRVYFVEEPIYEKAVNPRLDLRLTKENLTIVVPHLPENLSYLEKTEILRSLIDELIEDEMMEHYSLWYYTPLAIPYSDHLKPKVTIYDCMDELSKFKGADPSLEEKELQLLSKADLVFTGGQSLYEAKRERHSRVHAFPSAIDSAHFMKARTEQPDPVDQKHIPHPRLGFVGVIDERMNLKLIKEMAQLRPQWQFVMLGPVVKIDPETLPQLKNIHYLGMKSYSDLPSYLANWDCALMPFAKNEATRYISPTKTPEYLAAGLPVISTSIRDVVEPYGKNQLVEIADTAEGFIQHAEKFFKTGRTPDRLQKIDRFLKNLSWDETWRHMASLELDIYGKMRGVLE